MRTKTIINSETGKRDDCTEYPITAIREAVINALVHRDYSIPTIRKELEKYNLVTPEFLDERGSFIVKFYKKSKQEQIQTNDGNDLIRYCKAPRTRKEICDHLGMISVTYAIQKHILPLIETRQIKMSIPDKPKVQNNYFIVKENHMKVLVTYQSKTGFTKKYAEWIAQDVNAEIKEISKTSMEEVAKYDVVIHGGWIMGGMINGLDKIRNLNPNKLYVFGVGFTQKKEVDIAKCIQVNKLEDTPFFYFEGGMDPKKMGFLGRTMVKMVTKRTPVYVDNTDRNEISELVKLVLESQNPVH